jgi:hypothetical protein
MESRVLFQGRFARAVCFNPGAAKLFVTFDNWRRVHVDFEPVQPSVRVVKAGFAHLCIHSSRNDWYLSPDLGALRAALAAATGGYQAVHGIGFSMGAYGALLLSKALRLQKLVLVSPQFSVFPDRPPFDPRYGLEAAGLVRELDDLARDIQPGLQGVVLFDPAPWRNDRAHALEIEAVSPGLQLVAMPFTGHPAMAAIREAQAYGKVMTLAISGDLTAQGFRRIHRATRILSPHYQGRLRKYLLQRSARAGGGANVVLPC